MSTEIVELKEDLSGSPLYSPDLAPVPISHRTWNVWSLAALWVGMAVCIPTYILASYMIKSGLSWQASLIIIGLANILVTIPMVLNGHVGVKYGIPFPVFGRASFGFNGIHIASIIRAVVACGWFGVQTWIGGLAFYSIWCAMAGSPPTPDLNLGKFICFGLFWWVNIYFIWAGTESIKWLENLSAPILILIGILLIVWSANKAGGFGLVLDQGAQLEKPSVVLNENGGSIELQLNPIRNIDGSYKASEYRVSIPLAEGSFRELGWTAITDKLKFPEDSGIDKASIIAGKKQVQVQFRSAESLSSSIVRVSLSQPADSGSKLWGYILWLTAMVGFWATMSLSISDITRYAASQKDQVAGQFIGLPGTMVLYSFVGIFVTCAAVINFKDVLIADDAPWDPVSLLARFETPAVVIVSQIFMIIATLTTNIAANVIAPANALSNLFPKKLSFKGGGTVAGIIGIIICPWWLLNEISGILIFVSGLLGPVLGILVCDYYVIRKTNLNLAALYKTDGEYAYTAGINPSAIIALVAGVLSALIGYWIPALAFLYHLSWFTGVIVSGGIYYLLMKSKMK